MPELVIPAEAYEVFPGLSDSRLAESCWAAHRAAAAALGHAAPPWAEVTEARQREWSEAVGEGAALVANAEDGGDVTFAAVATAVLEKFTNTKADFDGLELPKRLPWLACARHLANLMAKDPGEKDIAKHEGFWGPWARQQLGKEPAGGRQEAE